MRRFSSPDGLSWSEDGVEIDPVARGLSDQGFGVDAFLPSPTSAFKFQAIEGVEGNANEGGTLWAFPLYQWD